MRNLGLSTILIAFSITGAKYLSSFAKLDLWKNDDSTDEVINEMMVYSDIKCFVYCVFDSTCMEFAYSAVSRKCKLLSERVTTGIIDDGQPTLPYYIMEKGCSNPICPIYMGFYFDEEQCTCLKYIDTPMVPTEAKTECERNGANLVRIDSNTKQQYIYNLLDSRFNTKSAVWIQGFRFTNGTAIFDEGLEMTFFYWLNGEPNGSNNVPEPYMCLFMSHGGYWVDAPATYSNAHVLCEIVM